MKKIYKYKLGVEGDITAPIIKFLEVEWQNDVGPVVWTVADEALESDTYQIVALGTGWEIPKGVDKYLGTVQDKKGFVWHYFTMRTEELKTNNAFKNIGVTADEIKDNLAKLIAALP